MSISLSDSNLEELRLIITKIITKIINPPANHKGIDLEDVEKIISLIKEKISGSKNLESAGHTLSDEIDTHIMELLNINFIEYHDNA